MMVLNHFQLLGHSGRNGVLNFSYKSYGGRNAILVI